MAASKRIVTMIDGYVTALLGSYGEATLEKRMHLRPPFSAHVC